MGIDTTEQAERAGGATNAQQQWAAITHIELGAAAVVAAVMGGLAIAEPDILGAPFENTRTVAFTFGGTAAAAVALVVMLRRRVHPVARIMVLGVPLVAVSWWLLSPFFIDDVVNDEFLTSIAGGPSSATEQVDRDAEPGPDSGTGPVLLGAGQFVGLAGHHGSGDAGFFALADGSRVLRLENFDIQNGPDLRLYVLAGADQTDPSEGSLSLGKLRGNIGNQTYDLPDDFDLGAGAWTVLVWCEAFRVEFVAATVTVT